MVGRILGSSGRIAISPRTFSISSGNQSGPESLFLRLSLLSLSLFSLKQGLYKVYQSSGLVTISTISPYLLLSRSDPHFPLSPVALPPTHVALHPFSFPPLSLTHSPVFPALLRFSTSLKVPSSRNYESLYTRSTTFCSN